MNNFLQIILPIITLLLGYFLNVFLGSIESNREIKRRRIAEKEKAYGEITGKLHELFEEYRKNTLKETSHISGTPLFGKADSTIIYQKFDELDSLVYKYSLFLKPNIIQALIDLKLFEVRKYIGRLSPKSIENSEEHIHFLEQFDDEIWKKAKQIISEMRDELGLEKYPEDLLNHWKKKD